MQTIDTTHLGDGAYAGHDGYQLWLGANDHRDMTVALDMGAFYQLVAYAERSLGWMVQPRDNSPKPWDDDANETIAEISGFANDKPGGLQLMPLNHTVLSDEQWKFVLTQLMRHQNYDEDQFRMLQTVIRQAPARVAVDVLLDNPHPIFANANLMHNKR